jgi:hypothetical protein
MYYIVTVTNNSKGPPARGPRSFLLIILTVMYYLITPLPLPIASRYSLHATGLQATAKANNKF